MFFEACNGNLFILKFSRFGATFGMEALVKALPKDVIKLLLVTDQSELP